MDSDPSSAGFHGDSTPSGGAPHAPTHLDMEPLAATAAAMHLSAQEIFALLPQRLREKVTSCSVPSPTSVPPAIVSIDKLALPAWETAQIRVTFSNLTEYELEMWKPAVTRTSVRSEVVPLSWHWAYDPATSHATMYCTLPPMPHLESVKIGAKRTQPSGHPDSVTTGGLEIKKIEGPILSAMVHVTVMAPAYLVEMGALGRPGTARDIGTLVACLNNARYLGMGGRTGPGALQERTASGTPFVAAFLPISLPPCVTQRNEANTLHPSSSMHNKLRIESKQAWLPWSRPPGVCWTSSRCPPTP